MNAPMHRRRLRAAFVVTLGVTASQACTRENAPLPGNPPVMHTPDAQPALVVQPAPVVAPTPACPTANPIDGTACPSVGQRCVYESCGVTDGATATCGATGWQTERVTCNPPPPPRAH